MKLSNRNKSVLAGLYLSKFDSKALDKLGFESFSEAFNVIGAALGVQPASIKNYRDEFDPLFPNGRKGWHKRTMREYCKEIYNMYKDLPESEFTSYLKEAIYKGRDIDVMLEALDSDKSNSFAKRLITGQAAEEYFRSKYNEIDEFKELDLEDTTRLGCGFDFRLSSPTTFIGVEVKGLSQMTGNVSLTDKEYSVAKHLKGRYFLFVVRNFRETPMHLLFRDPVAGALEFEQKDQFLRQTTWTAKIDRFVV